MQISQKRNQMQRKDNAMFKETFTIVDEDRLNDATYLAPKGTGHYTAGDEMICAHGLVDLFNFNHNKMPEKITLSVRTSKPKKIRGWHKGVLLSEYNSEIGLQWKVGAIGVYRNLIEYVTSSIDICDGDEFWFCIES